MNFINNKPDCHINLVFCGGSCVNYSKEYNQTLKLFMSEYSNNHMIVSSSDWSDYNDVIKYRESKYYCMIVNVCFISIYKPFNVYNESGNECVIIKITNDNEP
jgi:hypothetical protein